MNVEERQLLINTLWAAVGRLVPARDRETFTGLSHSLTAVYNAHADAQYQDGHAAGLTAGAAVAEQRYQMGKTDGMIEMSARMDRRDEDWPEAPAELRSVH